LEDRFVSLADNERGLADAYKNAVHIAERDRSRAARPSLPKKSTFFRPISSIDSGSG
jgi:hypothetical protein